MSKYEQLLYMLYADGCVTVSIVVNEQSYLVEYAFDAHSQATTWVDGVLLQKWTTLVWPTAARYPEGRFLCLHFTRFGCRLTRFWSSPDSLMDHLRRNFPGFELINPKNQYCRLCLMSQSVNLHNPPCRVHWHRSVTLPR